MTELTENLTRNTRKLRKLVTVELLNVIRTQVSNGMSNKEIALANDISLTCATRAANKIYAGLSNADIIKKKGRKFRINSDLQTRTAAIVQKDNSLTQEGIAKSLATDNILIKQPLISKILKSLYITRKRLCIIPIERKIPRIVELRYAYCREIEMIAAARLVYLDETGFNLHTSVHYGYSPVNTKAFTTAKANKGVNQSVMCVVDCNGVVAYDILDGAYNGDLMIDFINSKLAPYFREHRDAVLVMDNCKFHHRRDVLTALSTQTILYKFLPPYSPQLNPIEEFFSMLKAKYNNIRPKPKTLLEVKGMITRAFDALPEPLQAFYDHMREYMLLGLSRQPFI